MRILISSFVGRAIRVPNHPQVKWRHLLEIGIFDDLRYDLIKEVHPQVSEIQQSVNAVTSAVNESIQERT